MSRGTPSKDSTLPFPFLAGKIRDATREFKGALMNDVSAINEASFSRLLEVNRRNSFPLSEIASTLDSFILCSIHVFIFQLFEIISSKFSSASNVGNSPCDLNMPSCVKVGSLRKCIESTFVYCFTDSVNCDLRLVRPGVNGGAALIAELVQA